MKVVTADEKKRGAGAGAEASVGPEVKKVLGFGNNLGYSSAVMPATPLALNNAVPESKKERKFYEMMKVAKEEHSTNPGFNHLAGVNARLYNWLNRT